MRAVADSNLARMAQLWGTDRGSAAATGNPSNWQQRVVIMHAYLRGSASRVIADLEAPNDRRVVTLEMDRPGCQKQVPFTLVALRGGGWIIVAIDIDAAGNPLKPCGAGGR